MIGNSYKFIGVPTDLRLDAMVMVSFVPPYYMTGPFMMENQCKHFFVGGGLSIYVVASAKLMITSFTNTNLSFLTHMNACTCTYTSVHEKIFSMSDIITDVLSCNVRHVCVTSVKRVCERRFFIS